MSNYDFYAMLTPLTTDFLNECMRSVKRLLPGELEDGLLMNLPVMQCCFSKKEVSKELWKELKEVFDSKDIGAIAEYIENYLFDNVCPREKDCDLTGYNPAQGKFFEDWKNVFTEYVEKKTGLRKDFSIYWGVSVMEFEKVDKAYLFKLQPYIEVVVS